MMAWPVDAAAIAFLPTSRANACDLSLEGIQALIDGARHKFSG